MLNRYEKERLLKGLEKLQKFSNDLQKTMTLLMETRDKAQKGFEQVSALNVKVGLLEEEIIDLIAETPEKKEKT